jgi:ribonuclease HI
MSQSIVKVLLSWHPEHQQVVIFFEKAQFSKKLALSLSDIAKDARANLALFLALTQVIELSEESDSLDIRLSGWPVELEPHYFSWFKKSRAFRDKTPEQYQSFLHNLHALILQLCAPKAVNLKHRLISATTTIFSSLDNLGIEDKDSYDRIEKNMEVISVNALYRKHLRKNEEVSHYEKQNKKINVKIKRKGTNHLPTPVLFYKQYQKRELEFQPYNLFCDASVRPLEKRACIAGYIQDANEQLINYRQALDYEAFKDNNLAEIYALWQGLYIAHQMKITHIKIFTDSMFAVEHTRMHPNRKTQNLNESFRTLLLQIKELLTEFEFYQIEHVHRNYNTVADEMTHF